MYFSGSFGLITGLVDFGTILYGVGSLVSLPSSSELPTLENEECDEVIDMLPPS